MAPVEKALLQRTFVFLPGIGPAREAMLWRRGVDTWARYRATDRVPGVRAPVKAQHDDVLAIAEERLARDPHFFARLLPSAEHWRAYGTFAENAAYVDIETTGDRRNAITVVGVRHRGQNRAFVDAGPDPSEAVLTSIQDAGGVLYTSAAVSDFLSTASSLVTFNGASFDLPVMTNEGITIPRVPHADLRLVFARSGYTGGLKKIEETLDMGRTGEIAGLSGWDAVKLWRKWEARHDQDALRTLIAYNVADFENLEPLARLACDRLTTMTIGGLTTQARLLAELEEPGAPPVRP